MKLTPDTNFRQIDKHYSGVERETRRESDARLRRLQNLAAWLIDSDVSVDVHYGDWARSMQIPEKDQSYFIQIPTQKIAQEETDLDGEKWDWLFQKAELVHELGHVLYTDFETLREYLYDHPKVGDPGLFKSTFNATEDGAIERQLAAEFNVGNDLAIKNANLFGGQSLNYSVFNEREAIRLLLFDWAKYDTGRGGQLLDPGDRQLTFKRPASREYVTEHLSEIQDYVDTMLTEPEGDVRVDATMAFYESVLNPLEHLAGSNPYETREGVVSGANADGEQQPADELGEPQDAAESESSESDDPGDPEDVDEEEAEESITVASGGSDEDDFTAEREEAQAMVKSMGKEDVNVSVELPDGSNDGDDDRLADAERHAMALERIFKQRLQKVTKTRRESGHRSGRVDTRSMRKLRRGDTRVFEREEAPERPDYNVCFVADRSGSMSGSDVRNLERAVGALTLAFDGVDVDTSVLSFEGRTVRLEKPFGADPEHHTDALFSGRTGGGTPTHRALEVARSRLEHKEGQSYVIVVTDGHPNDEGAYISELEACSVPVLGVMVGSMASTSAEDYFDYATTISSTDELSDRLRSLAKHFIV